MSFAPIKKNLKNNLIMHPVSNMTLQQRANILYSKEKGSVYANMPRYTNNHFDTR